MSKFFNKLLGKATGGGEGKRERERQGQRAHLEQLPDAELTSDDVVYRETVHHGMPTHSTSVCYDDVQGLLAGMDRAHAMSRASLAHVAPSLYQSFLRLTTPVPPLRTVGTKDGKVKVFGAQGVERLLVPSGGPAPVSCLAFGPGLGFLAVGTNLPALYVFDLREQSRQHARCTAIELREFPVSLHALAGAGFLNIGTSGTQVRFLKFGEEYLSDYKIGAADLQFGKEPTDIVAACSHPGGALNLLVAGRSGWLAVWDMRGRSVAKRFMGAGTGAELQQACWSPDAKVVAAGYADGTIQLWSADSDKAVLAKLVASSAGGPIVDMVWREFGPGGGARSGHVAQGAAKDRRDSKAQPPDESSALLVLTAAGSSSAKTAADEGPAEAGGQLVLMTGTCCQHMAAVNLADLACSSGSSAHAEARVAMAVCPLSRRTTPAVVLLVTDGGALEAVPLSLGGSPKKFSLNQRSVAAQFSHTLPEGPVTSMHHMAAVPISLVHTLLQEDENDDEWEHVASRAARALPSPMDPHFGGRRPCPPLTSPAPALLVTAHGDGGVHVWDVRTESLLLMAGARVQRPLDLWERDVSPWHSAAAAAAEPPADTTSSRAQECRGERRGSVRGLVAKRGGRGRGRGR